MGGKTGTGGDGNMRGKTGTDEIGVNGTDEIGVKGTETKKNVWRRLIIIIIIIVD